MLRTPEPELHRDEQIKHVILYEMLFGFPPFVGKSMQETGLRIVHWKRSLRLPRDAGVSENAIDLIRHLLCEPDVRYGYE